MAALLYIDSMCHRWQMMPLDEIPSK